MIRLELRWKRTHILSFIVFACFQRRCAFLSPPLPSSITTHFFPFTTTIASNHSVLLQFIVQRFCCVEGSSKLQRIWRSSFYYYCPSFGYISCLVVIRHVDKIMFLLQLLCTVPLHSLIYRKYAERMPEQRSSCFHNPDCKVLRP